MVVVPECSQRAVLEAPQFPRIFVIAAPTYRRNLYIIAAEDLRMKQLFLVASLILVGYILIPHHEPAPLAAHLTDEDDVAGQANFPPAMTFRSPVNGTR